jgi:predicted membrane chloride channel (bestrophin family)
MMILPAAAVLPVAMLAFVHPPTGTQLQSPSLLLSPRVRVRNLVRCSLGERMEEIVDEVGLEQRASLVELPVMFVSEGDRYTFDFERWAVHRSPSRYYRLLFGILFGVTSRRIFPVMVALVSFASLVCIYGQLCLTNPNLVTLQLPLTPFELTAPALGLLLVFRSDNSNARFKEGSELSWEISSSIRSAMRRLLAWTAAPHVPESERAAANELVHACGLLHGWIMTEHLRCGEGEGAACPIPGRHDDLLAAALGEEGTRGLEAFEGWQAPTPYLGIEAISIGASQRLPSLTDQELVAFDESLSTVSASLGIRPLQIGSISRLDPRPLSYRACGAAGPSVPSTHLLIHTFSSHQVTDALGTCEAFLRTPIPLGYTRYSVRFLWVWLTMLPFALTRTYNGFQLGTWWEGKVDEPWPLVVASVGLIGSVLLSIEDIAVQIEEPFAVLPLDFQHRWLLRDVEKSQQLLEFSMGNATAAADLLEASARRSPSTRERVETSRPPSVSRSVRQRLAELNELLEEGLITEREHKDTRKAILSSL